MKFNRDEWVLDLEDIVCTFDDDNHDDDNMPGVEPQTYDSDNDELPGLRYINDDDIKDYTYTNNKGNLGVTTQSGQVVKEPKNFRDADCS